jgi:hypothetical protein
VQQWLARRYKLPLPKSIRFVDNQKSQWGSCTPSTGDIRLSSRLTQFPPWVLDYVIVHELAHLIEFHHNAKFNALVDQYPKAERARGFLTGVHYSPDDQGDGDPVDVVDAVGDVVPESVTPESITPETVAPEWAVPPMRQRPVRAPQPLVIADDYRSTLF